jgi:hypothetical protein
MRNRCEFRELIASRLFILPGKLAEQEPRTLDGKVARSKSGLSRGLLTAKYTRRLE